MPSTCVQSSTVLILRRPVCVLPFPSSYTLQANVPLREALLSHVGGSSGLGIKFPSVQDLMPERAYEPTQSGPPPGQHAAPYYSQPLRGEAPPSSLPAPPVPLGALKLLKVKLAQGDAALTPQEHQSLQGLKQSISAADWQGTVFAANAELLSEGQLAGGGSAAPLLSQQVAPLPAAALSPVPRR